MAHGVCRLPYNAQLAIVEDALAGNLVAAQIIDLNSIARTRLDFAESAATERPIKHHPQMGERAPRHGAAAAVRYAGEHLGHVALFDGRDRPVTPCLDPNAFDVGFYGGMAFGVPPELQNEVVARDLLETVVGVRLGGQVSGAILLDLFALGLTLGSGLRHRHPAQRHLLQHPTGFLTRRSERDDAHLADRVARRRAQALYGAVDDVAVMAARR
jgi:hypothetical protein